MNSLQDVEKFKNPIDVPVNHTDLSLILRKRLERINHEMDDFTLIVCNFSLAVDYELDKFVKDMAELQYNLNRINGYKQNNNTKAIASGSIPEKNEEGDKKWMRDKRYWERIQKFLIHIKKYFESLYEVIEKNQLL